MRRFWMLTAALGIALTGQTAQAQIDARMLRYPDVSDSQIAFVYADDIWIAPREGGEARRLSSPQGGESFPRFSPDGSQLAFTANYEGNSDVYVVSPDGGLPVRITHHPAPDRMVDWYPDGESLLYATSMTSEKNRFNHLYKIGKGGGLPEKLPVPYGEFASLSPDGESMAYMPGSRDFRTWKRYRGGLAPDIWTFNLDDFASENITANDANDSQPMWHESTLYFLSDRDENRRANIWAYDFETEDLRQVTHFEIMDVHFPSIGPKDIVLENEGRLYLLDLDTEELRQVFINVVTDQSTLRSRTVNVSKNTQWSTVSPSGKRAIIEARGELFSVPAEHGVVRNLTRTSGIAERYPSWSPDGNQLAFFSDESGEYELVIRPASGKDGEETTVPLGPGFRYAPQWSPDSKKIVFIDQTMTINLYDIDTEELSTIDKGLWMYHGSLQNFAVGWSADSRWVSYSRGLETQKGAIFLYDTDAETSHQVTSGFYSDGNPRFDPDGKYLYFFTDRNMDPSYSDFDNTWVYANATQIAAVPLRDDVPSPLAPRNDEEEIEDEESDDEDGEDEEDADEAEGDSEESAEEEENDAEAASEDVEADSEDKDEDKEDKDKVEPVEIDLDDFERRLVLLPPKAGNFARLHAVSGKVIYHHQPRTGSGGTDSPLAYYDLKERKEETILKDVDSVRFSANGEKLLVFNAGSYYVVDAKKGQKLDKKMPTGGLEATIDPKAEWRQLFTEAWRLNRDYFYDPTMHGVDWDAMYERYSKLIDDVVTRRDMNFVIGELIGELSSSHTYRNGGDLELSRSRNVGLLGCDFTLENGAYRIAKIVDGAPWDAEVRSPLLERGIEVHEGDYVLAVNGVPIDTTRDPWAAFQGMAGKTIALTVNSEPSLDDSREVFIKPISSEARLRNLAWINKNRERVDVATNGRVGYIYVPDTGRNGQRELERQYLAQIDKPGLIIDERFNSGGQIPDRFVELLNRKIVSYYAVRDGRDWQSPAVAHNGPKLMLMNGWSGSGGDAFPFMFKEAGLGPLMGTRTWGGLIGMTGVPGLIDGGSVTVPTFAIYSHQGEWIIEGYGVDPDIEVPEDPTQLASGIDNQLERAIDEMKSMLSRNPPRHPQRPEYDDRSGR